MRPSIWTIGKSAVAGALLFAVLGAILESFLGARFPLSLLPPVMAIGATVVGYYVSKKPGPAGLPTPNLGSARFASGLEINELTQRAPESLAIGWTVNDKNTERPLLYYSGPGHLLTIAPTRSGKGVGAIIPNLLIADRSVFVIDPKGENARITARRRRAFGPVHVLDPFEISSEPCSRFNPLSDLHGESLDLTEDAATLADALVIESGDAKDAHWNDEAKALIAGVIMYVAVMEKPDARTLDRVRQYLTLPPDAFREFLQEMSGLSAARGLIARTGGRFLGKSGPEFAGVVSTAQRHTQFLDSPRIASALSHSDFSFADLASGVASIFVVLPPDRLEAYNRWLRLMINSGLRELTRTPTKPARPILFLLDEFAALGRLDEVRRGVGLMAGYGVQFWPILQDFSQLISIYGASADTFIANAEVLQAFNVQDYETAKRLSDRLGDRTVMFVTQTESSGVSSPGMFGKGSTTYTSGSSYSTQAQARRLMKPEEILNMMDGLELLFVKGYPPMQVGKIRYFEREEFAELYGTL